MTDFIVIGGGSAGCVLAAELSRRKAGSVMVLEAGPSERHPLVSMPMALMWLMGSNRDWAWKTSPQEHAGGRMISVPRGRMLGGSGSINSMVWFRGRAADFDDWDRPGWRYADLEPAFEAVEAKLRPTRMTGAHPLSEGLAPMLGSNGQAIPTPEYESAGVCAHNLIMGRRNSAADAFLRRRPDVEIKTGAQVDRLLWQGDRATGVRLVSGEELYAAKGVVLSAGSLASPAILMRSGIGPADHLRDHGIDVRRDAPQVGENLHDHPGCGLHFCAPGSGYGLEPAQWLDWLAAPFRYYGMGTGRLASPTVEAAAFFNARGDCAEPDVQSHFIPFHLDWTGNRYALKSGYFADVVVCRPKSRGRLTLKNSHGRAAPVIDLGLFKDESDLDTLHAGLERLRDLLEQADFGPRRAAEAQPGAEITGEALRSHIRQSAGTAYHPVGTLALGGPVTDRLAVKDTEGLWVADASVMPNVTSANTNAPSMMIGYRGAEFIAEDAA
ncbi:GMC family oxidoreductase [Primorskyibacter sp. S187A]|uniref:GMC family oxidoreductase n=1 Tax=Primorskyibacter sp. S187A TaxID=3415130 RepID=UPI003C7E5FCD